MKNPCSGKDGYYFLSSCSININWKLGVAPQEKNLGKNQLEFVDL